MKCPNCGKNMTRDYCMVCGYMKNGRFIDTKKKHVTLLEKALGEEYYIITRGDNQRAMLFIGPLYLSYRNYYFLGVILTILDIYSYYNAIIFCEWALGYPFYFAGFIFYLVLNRVFWIVSIPLFNSFMINLKLSKAEKMTEEERTKYLSNIKIKNEHKLLGAMITLVAIAVFIYIFKITR